MTQPIGQLVEQAVVQPVAS